MNCPSKGQAAQALGPEKSLSVVPSDQFGNGRTGVLVYTSTLPSLHLRGNGGSGIEDVMVVGWHTGVAQAGLMAYYTTLLQASTHLVHNQQSV